MRRMTPFLLVLAACGGDSTSPPANSPSPSPTQVAQPEIKANDNSFSPRSLTVKAGTLIKVTNNGENPHTWTHKPLFDFPLNDKGSSGSFSFPKPGTYAYVCTIHEKQGMTGTVVVT